MSCVDGLQQQLSKFVTCDGFFTTQMIYHLHSTDAVASHEFCFMNTAKIGMIEVRLHYDQIAGAIEILQVPLHFYLYTAIFLQFQKEGKAH